MGKEGASLALRRRGIGMRGIELICYKMKEQKESDNFALYGQILTLNGLTLSELNIIYDEKIPQIVNEIYRKKSIRV